MVRHKKENLQTFQSVIFIASWYHAQWNLTCSAAVYFCVWRTSY